MNDAISRSAVLDRLEMLRRNYTLKAGYRDAMTDAIGEVSNAHTLDAVPVVHGHWIWDEVSFNYTCSSCKCSYDYSETYGLFEHGFEYTSYCPNCGARMDGEENAAD